MITFNYETEFNLKDHDTLSNWIQDVITYEGFVLGEINYIFCDDEYLLKLNVEFLNHDTLTDIISFDNTIGKSIAGDIFISVDRVKENSQIFNTDFDNELHRVMIHGVLHYLGFKDKTESEKQLMRRKENSALNQLSI